MNLLKLRLRPQSIALVTALVAVMLPGAIGPGVTAPAPAVAVAPANLAVAEELLQLVNAERQRVNAPPLTLNAQLTTAAQRHSEDMAASRRLSHTGSDGSTMRSRIDATQYQWSTIGENVAMGQPTAAAVMAAWMNSPGHRQNMLNPAFTELGIGYANGAGRPYWTQVFARPR
ncbi:MAG: CAP domain-containing protein [Leptolyngbya sp. DLM2.Bin27]|nr:MAG: CAP domain-containing protein [Leptolyngbya sp. DLM2.Bin27]